MVYLTQPGRLRHKKTTLSRNAPWALPCCLPLGGTRALPLFERSERLTLFARRRPRQRYRQRAESCAWKLLDTRKTTHAGHTQHTGFGARPKWFSVLRCLFTPNMLGHGSCVAARLRGIATWPPRARRAVHRGRRNVAPSYACRRAWRTPPCARLRRWRIDLPMIADV